LRVTPVKASTGGNTRQDFTNERDRLIHIIDQLVLSSKTVPDGLRLTTTFGTVNRERCQRLLEFLQDSTDDRLVRIRNLTSRLLKFLDK